jgi:hypothetical protein
VALLTQRELAKLQQYLVDVKGGEACLGGEGEQCGDSPHMGACEVAADAVSKQAGGLQYDSLHNWLVGCEIVTGASSAG